jgi:hypothetical protein
MIQTRSRFEEPDPKVVEILRTKTSSERLSIASGMWVAARKMLFNLLADQHPSWDQDRLEKEVARRLSHGSV